MTNLRGLMVYRIHQLGIQPEKIVVFTHYILHTLKQYLVFFVLLYIRGAHQRTFLSSKISVTEHGKGQCCLNFFLKNKICL